MRLKKCVARARVDLRGRNANGKEVALSQGSCAPMVDSAPHLYKNKICRSVCNFETLVSEQSKTKAPDAK